jgi:hypothetical protein
MGSKDKTNAPPIFGGDIINIEGLDIKLKIKDVYTDGYDIKIDYVMSCNGSTREERFTTSNPRLYYNDNTIKVIDNSDVELNKLKLAIINDIKKYAKDIIDADQKKNIINNFLEKAKKLSISNAEIVAIDL